LPLPSGLWSLQGLIPGMYALDVTADMSSSGILGTYETYLVVLEPGQQPLPPTTVISQITIEYTEDCPGNTTLVNGTCVEPLARCPVNSTLVNGTCVNPSPPTPPIICPADGTSTNQTCPPLPCPTGTSTNGTCVPFPPLILRYHYLSQGATAYRFEIK
jgi:hypothetical protein